MARLRFNAVAGVLSQNIGPQDNMLTSVGVSRMGDVVDPDTALIVLYAKDDDGNIIRSENVEVTIHNIGAGNCFVNRGVDGTIAQDWPAGTTWYHTFEVSI
jgi:hypothetical protein